MALEPVLREVSYVVRTLCRRPGFTFIAAATVALAIGANPTIDWAVKGGLPNALPFEQPPEELVVGDGQFPGIAAQDLAAPVPGGIRADTVGLPVQSQLVAGLPQDVAAGLPEDVPVFLSADPVQRGQP
jgi:hypothetical protein